MIVDFTVYDQTGKVVRTGACPAGMEQYQYEPADGENIAVINAKIETTRIDATTTPGTPTVVVLLPASISLNKSSFTADGVDIVIFSGVPINSSVSIKMPALTGLTDIYGVTVNDGALSISTTIRGLYVVEIRNANHTIYEASVNAY